MNHENLYVYDTEVQEYADCYSTNQLICKVLSLVCDLKGTLLSLPHASVNECLTDIMVRELDELERLLIEKHLLWGCVDVKGFSGFKKKRRGILREHFQKQVKLPRKRNYGIIARMEYNPVYGYVFDVYTHPRVLTVNMSPTGFVVSQGRCYRDRDRVYKTALELMTEIHDTYRITLLPKDQSVADAIEAMDPFTYDSDSDFS